MERKIYLSPQADVFVCDERDVVRTSNYVESKEGFDDNLGSWEEVFGS